MDYTYNQMEREVDLLFERHGSTRIQRDAFYFGYKAGQEIRNKQQQKPSLTDFLGEIKPHNDILLQNKLNRFFAESGFTTKEKLHFRKGVEFGKMEF
ncbi:hypothetical protein [Paenibacillus polymyxa]|uniref:Uncharacterized protein n=1 Tax=Paenibacillus polymyxa (strain SC2) TaxID=886882 RepID=A0A0D5ZCM1_PAEPS|nr:hypothetical protein [Paenibacillus polymyxa]AKA44358.1 hypothetical protein PPSC2_26660 [Paenibacillus polymyxa SC2]WPQ59483.1 hypothetical protein SKN87_27865 [Paenibacillus polymyxa]